jgi:lipoprotein-anchoring transpeptidase ErfK/SrfK
MHRSLAHRSLAKVALLTLTALLCAPAEGEMRRTRGRIARHQQETLDPNLVNDAQLKPAIGLNSKGPAVVRAQILLDRAHFSCGQIDGQYGINLQKTVMAFERNQNLQVQEGVGPAAWEALNADTAQALTTYTITQEDVAGPFGPVPENAMEQAKLKYLGYESPLAGLAEKFHSSPELLQALNPGKTFGQAEQQILVPNVITTPPDKAASVVVSKSDSSVAAYDANGKLLAYYRATIGSEHDPLPIGDWKILGVARKPVFHYDAELFWNAHNPSEKAEIPPGPRNPVGVVWIDLSKDHYGIHGTPDPSKIGHARSHGCIRLTNWDAWELADMVKPGTPASLKE